MTAWMTLWAAPLMMIDAFAHGGHDPRLKVSVSGDEIRVEMGLNADAFLAFDENDDGHLTVKEYETRYEAIGGWLDQMISLSGSDAVNILPYFSDAPIVGRAVLGTEDQIEHIKVLRRYKIKGDQDAYQLNIGLSGYSPRLYYSRSGQLGDLYKFEICGMTTGPQGKRSCALP